MQYKDRGDCIKCGEHSHELRDCQMGWRASVLTTQNNHKSEREKSKEQGKKKSKKTDSRTLKIPKLGSESETELENE